MFSIRIFDRPAVRGSIQSKAASAIRRIGVCLAALGALVSVTFTDTAGAAASTSSVTPDTIRYANCSWDKPGHNPFMGDVVAAVDRYQDIPADVRTRLKQRMAKRDYDDIASIKRDSLEGKNSYDPTIRDMHFGVNRVCTNVSRDKWTSTQEERGLVYCEGSECIIVPTVCRNVSRITRREPQALAGAGAPEGMGDAPPVGEMLFDPPGAGVPLAGDAPATFGPIGSVGPLGVDGPTFFPGAGIGGLAGPPVIAGISGGGGGPRDTTQGTGSDSGATGPGGSPPPGDGTGSDGGSGGGGGDTGNNGGGGILIPISGGGGGIGTGSGTVIPAVPEPGTWALMIIGLAACGAHAARRRRIEV